MNIVEGRTDIVRDPSTKAIINVDKGAHTAAVSSSKARRQAKEQLKNNTDEINTIKDDILEIKTMLRTLLNGR